MTTANANADLAPPMPIEVESLAYTFIGRDRASLQDISFRLPAACWTVVAGRTGSGKSTLLRALAGLIPHYAAGRMQGRVRLLGADTRMLGPAELARRVGLILQSPDDQLCATTVEAEIAFGLENLGLPAREIGQRIRAALAEAGLDGLRQWPTRRLSGGQKQRLLVASVRALDPRVLLLDEPLAQLDSLGAKSLLDELDRLRSQGVTIVVAEHRLDELAARADRLLVLSEGRLVEDMPAASVDLCDALTRQGLAPPEVSQLAQALGCGPLLAVESLFERLGSPPVSCSATAASDDDEPLDVGVHEAARSPSPVAVEPRPVLHVEDLGYRFPGSREWVWRGLDFSLHQGECVALVGANGSGKSTLLHLLAGFARPTTGRIEHEPTAGPQRGSDVGLVTQNPDLTLFCATVRDEVAYGPRQSAIEAATLASRVAELARQLNLESLLDEPPLALSQGQRLRTAVAAALSVEPRVLLLDEPTTGQDREQVERVMVAIVDALLGPRAAGCALFSTHDLSIVARHAGRVLVLEGGRLAADCTPDELLDDDALLARAHLRRPPLLEVRRRLALHGMTVARIAEEFRNQEMARRRASRYGADRPGADQRGPDPWGADRRGAGP
jgi:energy-coupling factor transport system ATP-binding protein